MEIEVPGQPDLGNAGAENTAEQTQVTSLDSLSEFEFQGEKYTPDRLQELIHGYRQSTERLQSIAEQERQEQRYLDNLDADIAAVIEKPHLAQQFKAVYPKKYHQVLDRMLTRMGKGDETQSRSGLPPEFLQKLERVDLLEQRLHQYEVEAANAKIDAILPKLLDKYPMAIEDQILAKAEVYLQNGGRLNEQTWERLVKESHELARKKADAYYKRQMENQISKGQIAKDAGPGGATPGQAPKAPKTFAEAERAMIEEMKRMGL